MGRTSQIDDQVRGQMLAEYLSDSRISLSELAKKYNISYTALTKLSREEKWNDMRSVIRSKEIDAAMAYITRTQSARLKRAIAASDEAVRLAQDMLDNIKAEMQTTGKQNTKALRDISGVLKDLKDYQILRYDLDRREQEARIAKMEHDADTEDQTKEITINIEGGEKWQS